MWYIYFNIKLFFYQVIRTILCFLTIKKKHLQMKNFCKCFRFIPTLVIWTTPKQGGITHFLNLFVSYLSYSYPCIAFAKRYKYIMTMEVVQASILYNILFFKKIFTFFSLFLIYLHFYVIMNLETKFYYKENYYEWR